MLKPEEIAAQLSKYKPLRPVIKAVGAPPSRRAKSPATRFPTLVQAILHQQLAGAAAAAIHRRFLDAVDQDVSPEAVLSLSDDDFAGAGISGAKRAAIRELSERVIDGRLHLAKHGRMADDAVINEMVQVRGIGVWTAQMYLMSSLGRHDVWPTGDYGVRNGWSIIHRLDTMITPKNLELAGAPLSPHRSAVAWYCWAAVDLLKGQSV